MSVLDVLMHDLVGVDANGSLCSCGARCVSWLEHLGAVALESLGVGEPVRNRVVDEDTRWANEQQSKANLASFGRQKADRRKRVPRPRFTYEQLVVAERWAAAEAARNEEAA